MSRFISMVIAVFALLTIATCAQAQVGICAPSNAVGESGIGDGCSVPGWAPYTFPTVGAFEGTFTQSCNWHDKCYTSIGTSYSECNGNFLSDMKGACANNYPVYLLPDVYSTCIATANMYYAAVVYYANTYEVTKRFRQTCEATAFHEAVPGHHFQLTIQLEQQELPLLRRMTAPNAYATNKDVSVNSSVLPGTSTLVPGGGRINLTLRRVNWAAGKLGGGQKKAPGCCEPGAYAPLRA